MRARLRSLYRRLLPVPARQWLTRNFRYPYANKIDLGDLGRTQPISRVWGLDRGTPVDRYYIHNFLASWSAAIRGHVLEIGEDTYTRQYGGERVQKSDILHVAEGAPNATIIADLTRAEHIPAVTFDCIICTQTLHLIYEVDLAIFTLRRILKPGGALLATMPGISQISRYDMDRWGDYWRFTSASARRLFEKSFAARDIRLQVYGNVLAATAFLQGIAAQELSQEHLDARDPDYEVLIGVRAYRGGSVP
ncbi:MAG TPA: methyltransferase domain-containing protein [Anaerolineales bacterium]|nr:methyltransferase domain-containing protein [Anaerolineales bacterium]